MQGVVDEDTSLTVIYYNDELLTVVNVDFSQCATSLSLISAKGFRRLLCTILFCTREVGTHICVCPMHR